MYKWTEAGGYYSGYPAGGSVCERVPAELDKATDLVLRIQKPDGYINSFFGNRFVAAKLRPPFDPENRFKFYNFDHLLQAGIARYRATGDFSMAPSDSRISSRPASQRPTICRIERDTIPQPVPPKSCSRARVQEAGASPSPWTRPPDLRRPPPRVQPIW